MIRDGCDLVPPAFVKPAVNLACGLLKAVKKTRTNYEDMQDLSGIASEFVLSIAIFCREHHIQLTKGLDSALSNFTSVLRGIVEKCILLADTSLVSRFLQQGRDSDTLIKLRAELQQAIKEFQLKTQILQHSDLHSISKIINAKLDGDVIKSLPKNPFFEGTRDDFIPEIQDDVLKQIATWIEDSSSPFLWLCGGAGFGKSSISHQLVYHLIDTGRLAAQMFFTRGSSMQRNLVTVIQTLAHEIASLHPKSVPDIANATRQGGSSHQELSAYIKRYLLAPVQALKLPRSIVIVLDGLDECENHTVLLKALSELSDFSGVKIFMTGRPKPSIENEIGVLDAEKVALTRLSQSKTEKYFSVRFNNMSWPHNQYPSPDEISQIAALAGGLLIWAATSCNFIENDMQDDEPYQLLQNIISAGKAREIASEDQLATLYRTTLAHLFGKHIHSFRSVFQAMLVVQVPMTVEVFAKAFDLAVRPTRAIHLALFALQIYESPDKEVILPAAHRFHASFLEYITNKLLHTHSTQFYINPSDAHSVIAQKCLSQIPDIDLCFREGQTRTFRNLEKHVQYVTGYWPFHVNRSVVARNLPPHEAHDALSHLARDGMPVWKPFYLIVSNHLSVALEGPDASNNIDKAVSFHTHSVKLFTAMGTCQTSDALSDFGLALWKHYEQTGLYKDLDESISMFSSFLDAHATASLQRAKALYRLGIALRARFNTPYSSKVDLDSTIAAFTEALELFSTPGIQNDVQSDSQHGTRHIQTMSALASTLRIRFEETGVAQDLDDAISMQTRAVDMMSQTADTLGHAIAKNGLATCLLNRFEETNNAHDLDRAITLLYSILQGRPAGHPYRPSTLNNLAFSLQRRYEHSGRIEDLDQAITMNYEVLESRPSPHQFRAQTLANIAQCLRYRFEVAGSFDALDEAISKDSEAVTLRPSSHPYCMASLNFLGHGFYQRFLHTGNFDDLTQAVANFQQAVTLCPKFHRDRYHFLNDLGNSLRSRFQAKGDKTDLADALQLQRQSYEECPPGNRLSAILHDLAATLLIHYEQTHLQETLSEAVGLLQEALKLRPDSNPRRSESLADLAKALHCRYKKSHERDDLNESLSLYNEALGLQSTTHVSRPITIEGLAGVLYSRFELDNSVDDLDKCISMYEELFTMNSSTIIGGRDAIVNGLTFVLVARTSNLIPQ
ncbi:hypothetical protein BDN70DRAFT_881166 [Pholiota conissans]|uniref:Nephrocystin 3-like N-terminal domain-containing protein n=1 Tax=Pholiota conissans TaxID=109636 RepID=A0A9P5YZD2_9AGAR|nr:hypothetical protein BDN70DRAFT_881166 [Pholiota conissans]